MLSHQERYNRWAVTYNADVQEREYQAPDYIIEYLLELVGRGIIDVKSEMKVLDAGCGTGLIGVRLQKQGFNNIDGVDFSPEMVEVARDTGAYQTLIGSCDLNQATPLELVKQYDLTICCGVFSFDLVKPIALQWLSNVTKPGGIILLTTRPAFCETYDFESYYQELERLEHIKFIDCQLNQPYLGAESNAHYWVFTVPSAQND